MKLRIIETEYYESHGYYGWPKEGFIWKVEVYNFWIKFGKGKAHRRLVLPGRYMKILCMFDFIRAYTGEGTSRQMLWEAQHAQQRYFCLLQQDATHFRRSYNMEYIEISTTSNASCSCVIIYYSKTNWRY